MESRSIIFILLAAGTISMKINESKKFYNGCYRIAGPVLLLFRPIKVIGRENMVDGAALVCANHSAMIDPLLIALSFDYGTNVHVLAKKELFNVPVLSVLLRWLGMISVDRSTRDAASIKNSLSYLKKGEKVVIFPEGTRMTEYDADAAKSGAVKIAEHAGVPILPVFIPRKKPFFKKSTIVFGKPYYIEKQRTKRSPDEYAALTRELMEKIQALEPDNQ